MKNKLKKILFLVLLLIPTSVFARSGSVSIDIIDIFSVCFFELIFTFLISIFFLEPLSKIISLNNSKKVFWILFIIRILISLYFIIFVTDNIMIFDFLLIFIGAVVIKPNSSNFIKNKLGIDDKQMTNNSLDSKLQDSQDIGVELRCAKCNAILQVNDNFCQSCGAPFTGNNVVVTEKINYSKKIVTPEKFDNLFSLDEDSMLEGFIKKEMLKVGFDKNTKLIHSDILKRKKVLNLIFGLLVFIYTTMIFFHFPLLTYIISFIILIIYFGNSRKYNLIKYLKKQVKARSNEKISNIVMSAKSLLIKDTSKLTLAISLIIAIVLPLIIFSTPKIIYEKVDGGYAVRYYLYGLTNYKTAVIPDTYKNSKIVSLRGNTFSNMYFLESVKLPDTITEIRGQAFKNCCSLTNVNIPSKLEYLGGGAFYNAKKIDNIILPDTLTFLGGESFRGASSLRKIKLSNNLTEIRGDTFSYCYSLQSIVIPDKVTRIGGHAFYEDYNLETVSISKNSNLAEIGSSAFRKCDSLSSIKIPNGTYINERAFKESPTSVSRY